MLQTPPNFPRGPNGRDLRVLYSQILQANSLMRTALLTTALASLLAATWGEVLAQAPTAGAAAARTVFLDADTANEVDDLYAIVRVFAQDDWSVPFLSSTQWQISQWATRESAEDSYRLNNHLALLLDVDEDTEVVRGGHRRMYDWGHQPIYSHAALELIELARAASPGEKVAVVALGALTNVASALLIAPDIAERIELYWLGSTYDFERDRAGTTDFNALMDPQAARTVFDHPTLRTHILPVSEVEAFTVHYDDVEAMIGGKGELADLLLQRWRAHLDGVTDERVLWDVAIVELLDDPSFATEVKAPGYGGPNVTAYRDLQGEKLFAQAMSRIGERVAEAGR